MKQLADHPFIYSSFTAISGSGILPLATERVSEQMRAQTRRMLQNRIQFQEGKWGGIVRIYFSQVSQKFSFEQSKYKYFHHLG